MKIIAKRIRMVLCMNTILAIGLSTLMTYFPERSKKCVTIAIPARAMIQI